MTVSPVKSAEPLLTLAISKHALSDRSTHFFPPFFVVEVPLLARIRPVAVFSPVSADLRGVGPGFGFMNPSTSCKGIIQ